MQSLASLEELSGLRAYWTRVATALRTPVPVDLACSLGDRMVWVRTRTCHVGSKWFVHKRLNWQVVVALEPVQLEVVAAESLRLHVPYEDVRDQALGVPGSQPQRLVLDRGKVVIVDPAYALRVPVQPDRDILVAHVRRDVGESEGPVSLRLSS